MVSCGSPKPAFSFVSDHIARNLGRKVILSRIGMAAALSKPGEDDIQWCSDCGRYYNPKSSHECNMKRVRDNRVSLERWLGSYKIQSESE